MRLIQIQQAWVAKHNNGITNGTSLQTWQDLGSVIADTNGFVQFADTNASNFPSRFYYTHPQ